MFKRNTEDKKPQICVFFSDQNRRSRIVGKAMYEGIRRTEGRNVITRSSRHYTGPISEIAIFYGLSDKLRLVLKDYSNAGLKAIYVDLGYWGRRGKNRYDGYHKLSLNDRHPTSYFQNTQHSAERFNRFGIPIKPWRTKGNHILVVGMSAKGAVAEGYRPQGWESKTVNRLRKITRRPIVYRPKPSWLSSTPIPGTSYGKNQPLTEALKGCHAVIAHHSNTAVDAILAGVPAFCSIGVAAPMCEHDLTKIETPLMPDNRLQWASDIAHTQWSIAEMKKGAAWKYLMREVL